MAATNNHEFVFTSSFEYNKYFYKNGNLKERGSYLLNKKNGLWINYFENGNMETKFTFVNGQLNGEAFDYYSDGRIEEKGAYINEYRGGIWTYYFYIDEEIIESQGTFVHGKKQNDWKTIKKYEKEK